MARRKALPGEVNITNNIEARVALAEFKSQKSREREGDAAKRDRTKDGGSEARLREVLGDGEVFVVNGQPVMKRSSQRHTYKVDLDTLKTAFPAVYAAVVTQVDYDFLQVL